MRRSDRPRKAKCSKTYPKRPRDYATYDKGCWDRFRWDKLAARLRGRPEWPQK